MPKNLEVLRTSLRNNILGHVEHCHFPMLFHGKLLITLRRIKDRIVFSILKQDGFFEVLEGVLDTIESRNFVDKYCLEVLENTRDLIYDYSKLA